MQTRPATDSDLQPIHAALVSYADTYSDRIADGRAPSDFIDGRPSNVEDAGWLHYECTDTWFDDGVLATVLPRLVMKVLVETQDCEWVFIDANNEVAVSHRDLDRPITVESLNDGSWLEEYDYDEPRSEGEVALASYDDLQRLFAKKRIFGTARPPT